VKSISNWLKKQSVGNKILLGVVASFALLAVAGAASEPNKPAPKVTHKTITETVEVPFDKTTVEDPTLAKGTTKVTTTGINGSNLLTYDVTYTDGKQTAKTLKNTVEKIQPTAEVTAIGTYIPPPPPPPSSPSCIPSYSPCVPNVSYDLDCPDIGFRVSVHGADPYNLDADNDGIGCERY
jgi:hypothetical protein